MKKLFLVLLATTLILGCILLVACNGETPENDDSKQTTNNETDDAHMNQPGDDYVISILSGGESGVFNASYVVNDSSERTVETVSDPTLNTLKVGNKEISAYKTEIVHMSSDQTMSVFLSADNNTEYRIYSTGNSFAISSQNNSVLYPYETDDLSENAMLMSIKEYISSVVDIADLDAYTLECSTSIVVQIPDAAWREEKAGIYTVPEDLLASETVMNYQFRFDKYCNGCKTSDSIVVVCSPSGDIVSLTYSDFGVNWSSFNINQDKLDNMIDAYLANAIATGYEIKEYTLDQKILVYEENQIKLSLTYELTLINNGSEISVLCPVLVAIQQNGTEQL